MIKRIVFALALLASCTDEEGTRHALRVSGYKDVTITGWGFGCSKDDGTCTGFVAKGPTGERVMGVVGCGFWSFSKGCTIRIK